MSSSGDSSPDAGIEVIVTADDEHLDKTAELAEVLREAGLDVTQVLDFVGVITGRWHREDFETLRSVEGVLEVEASGEVTLLEPSEDDSQE